MVAGVVLATVAILGSATCPSSSDVSAALAKTTADKPAPESSLHVEITESVDGVVLHMRSSDGRELASQMIARGEASCQDVANAAAVVIATWLYDADAWAPQVAPLAPSPPMVVVRQRPRLHDAVDYEVSASLLAAVAATGSVAVGAEGTVGLTKHGSRWAARLSLFGHDLRQQQLGFGTISWSRIALAAGASYRFGDVWQATPYAEAVAALLVVEGNGTDGSGAFNVDPGLRAGIRGTRRWRHIAGFIDVSVVGWLRSQEVSATTMSTTVALPRFDVLVGAGIAYAN